MEPTLIRVASFPAASGDEHIDKYFVVATTMTFQPRASPLAPWNCLMDGAGFLHKLPSHYLVILSLVRNPSWLMLADSTEGWVMLPLPRCSPPPRTPGWTFGTQHQSHPPCLSLGKAAAPPELHNAVVSNISFHILPSQRARTIRLRLLFSDSLHQEQPLRGTGLKQPRGLCLGPCSAPEPTSWQLSSAAT